MTTSAQTPTYTSWSDSKLPWNQYVPSRIQNDFVSIIGNGGTLLSGTSNATTTTNVGARVPLPFPFYFLGQTYPQGFNIEVAINGYISFNNPSTLYSYPYPYIFVANSTAYGFYQKCIAPYWSDMQTSGVSNPTGGAYSMLTGTAPNRVLTIEWRCQGLYYPQGNPGNFQAKLFEKTGNIEFHYGPSSINRTMPSMNPQSPGYGAFIGIKNTGQNYGIPSGDDAEKMLVFLHPEENVEPNGGVEVGRDTVAVTHFRTFNYAGTEYCAFYAYYEYLTPGCCYYYRPAPYYHYSFPTEDGSQIGYKMSPVLNDVSSDSAWFSPARPANAYSPGSTITVNARFRNMGANDRQNIPVRAQVFRNGTTLVATLTGTAFANTTIQFGTSNVTFTPTIGSSITNTTGEYTVKTFALYADDQDEANDTLVSKFYVARGNDLMPYAILQPFRNEPPLFTRYPVDIGVPVEIRYMNIGTATQFNARVGYQIVDASGTPLHSDVTTVSGAWGPITFRDVQFAPWTPTVPGEYYIKAFTLLANDETPANDTLPLFPELGQRFSVRYEIEVATGSPILTPHAPLQNSSHPIGKPVQVQATFINNGVTDATNIPARLQIRGPNGNTLVYDRTVTVSDIVGDGGSILQDFPSFIPASAGQYCVTAWVDYSQEPVRSNDTARWCFRVSPALSGTIRVGLAERFRSLNEAVDSLFFYGVSGPVTFELVDDSYTVSTGEPSIPALDFRGRVVGLGSNTPVTFRPAAGKTMVTVNLRSQSGIGMWFGQRDTSNPSGYITFDGGANKALRFVYENTNTSSVSPAYNRAVPFFFDAGSSNYTVRNSTIEPGLNGGRKSALTLPMVSYNQTFNEFRYVPSLNTTISSGVLLYNSAPIDEVSGRNLRNADTLRNQNNVIENNEIRNFGYGIVSVGTGPLFVVGTGRFEEYANQNNRFENNLIEDVARGGIVLAFEKGSTIRNNHIRRVANTSTATPGAEGISVSAGTGASGNRGYASDLLIEKNRVHDITTSAGRAVGIGIETSENRFVTPANVPYRFPASGATNMRIWNNMVWDVTGATSSMSVGIGLAPEVTVRPEFVTSGNRIENNTVFNQIGGNSDETGILMQRAGGMVRNNIIALTSPTTGPTGLYINVPNYRQTIVSDHNLFWVPNGYVGALTNLSSAGFMLPSPPVARTLNQWRALTGLDMSSVEGNITQEFLSTIPGAENLHIDPLRFGSLANNRGVRITDITTDIDNDPRGSSAAAGRYDIGADEFSGRVRTNDLAAEDLVSPSGYAPAVLPSGAANTQMVEFRMSDTLVPLTAVVRNVGGLPATNRDVTMLISWQSPTNTSAYTQVSQQTRRLSVDVAQAGTLDFGTFMPRTLKELGLSDPFYGNNPNVSPVYRIQITSQTDDFAGNNVYSKHVRFYLQRSGREAMVAVENLNAAAVSAVELSNKLNSDTLMSALGRINWQRADGAGNEDFDLFEREKWPSENLDFTPWSTIIWAQGEEPQGLEPEERAALKQMLDDGTQFLRSTLVIAGQEVSRRHDVALNASNGELSDQEFVRTYLRAEHRGATTPADYSNRKIQGVAINAGRFEELEATGVSGDTPPMPSTVAVTPGAGIARAAYRYVDQTNAMADSVAGVASSANERNVVYYAFDWRHAGRYDFEPDRSGAWRLLLGALDFAEQFRGVLPVELVSFDAFQSSATAVTVEWVTAQETELRAMEIERAEVVRDEAGERVGTFTTIETKSPSGTASRGAGYRTIDATVERGRTYEYRLVTVELDGRRVVEARKQVMITTSGAAMQLSMAPNPVRSQGVISWRGVSSETARVELFNERGQKVREHAVATSNGELRIDARDLTSGSYTLRLTTSDGRTLIEKVTVQK
jgi:hypothetical protein